MPSESWDIAGLTTANGRLDRPLAAGAIVVPERVDLLPATAERPLRIAWEFSRGEPRTLRPDDGLLDAFVKLHDDLEGKRVLRYARRCGPLKICAEHDLPASHNPPPGGGYNGPMYWCETRGRYGQDTETGYQAWEPVTAWHLFARQAQAILDVAARLHDDKLPRIEDWCVIYERQPRVDPRKWNARAATVSYERHKLTSILNEWLELGNVRPVVSWRPSQRDPTIELRAGLFGVIAMQLVQVVAKTVGLWICSGCGKGYARAIRPREGERNYCPECRAAGRPLRDAKYAYRHPESRPAHRTKARAAKAARKGGRR